MNSAIQWNRQRQQKLKKFMPPSVNGAFNQHQRSALRKSFSDDTAYIYCLCCSELCGAEHYQSEVELEPLSVENFEATVSDATMRERLVKLDCIDLVLHALREFPTDKVRSAMIVHW